MINRTFIGFFLCLTLEMVYATDESIRNNYFLNIKNLDYEEAGKVAMETQDERLRDAMLYLSNLLYNAGQSSITNQDSSLYYQLDSKLSSDHNGKIISKLVLGYYHFYRNPYTIDPIKNFSEAYRISKEIGTKEELKYTILSIIKLYNWELSQSNDDIKEYLDQYEKLITDSADDFHFQMNKFLYELRDIFYDVDLSAEFFETFERLMKNFEEEHHFWTEYYLTLGVYLKFDKQYEEATRLINQALERMGEEPFLKYLKFRSYIQLAEIARINGDYYSAKDYIDLAGRYSYLNDQFRARHFINYYLAPNLYGIGDSEGAYEALSRADTFRLKLDHAINSLSIAQYKWKFQTEEKEIALKRTQNWLLILLVLLIFISVLYYLVQKSTKRKQLLAIQEKDIHKQKVQNLLKEQELIALDSMIEGQEKERKRIAEDLHDRLGSTLSAVKMHVDVLNGNDDKFNKINSLIDRAVNDTREIAHNMLSGVLTKFGLLVALKDLKQTIEDSNHLRINIQSIQLDERLPGEVEIHIYRILQELISNTLKHSGANEVKIELTRNEDNLRINYSDNGKGFDTSLKMEGIGLRNIESRINQVGGNWELISRAGNGIRAEINLEI